MLAVLNVLYLELQTLSSIYLRVNGSRGSAQHKTNKDGVMKRILIDCSSGISGDMFLAALADMGCDFSLLEGIFRKAGIEVSIAARHISRMSGPGVLMQIDWPGAQPLRHLSDLVEIAERLDVSGTVRSKSVAMFRRLAQAEAEAHGTGIDEVHFHEVGAVDTIVDVVGAVWGLELLGAREVLCRPVPWFGGFVNCEHGRIPLPAPATLALLKGKPTYESGAMEELVTPTGALILDALTTGFITSGHPVPAAAMTGSLSSSGVFEKSGLGYGSREPNDGSDWPGRGLRLHLFSLLPPADTASPYIIDEVYLLSCHIDHLTGEELGHAIDMLGKAGVLDVLWMPGLTKKNRPSGELRVLCMIDMLPKIEREIFKHTHTLGIRVARQTRVTLPRRATEMDSPWGLLDAKEYRLLDHTFTKAEYEALAETAAREGIGLPALRVREKKD